MIYDLIGKIYKESGVMLTDSKGFKYPEMVEVEGYHVNVLDLTEEERAILEPYVVTVNSPSRVFAGRNDLICLRFKDREEWISLGFENVEEI